MPRWVYTVLIAVSGAQWLLAGALLLGVPSIVGLWPFEGTTRLSLTLVASFLAAAAASTLWTAVTRTTGALVGIGLNYLTILGPLAVFSFQLGAAGAPRLTVFGVECLVSVILGLGLIVLGRRSPIPADPLMPGLVRWSFVVFVVALLVAGGELLLRVPNVLPWAITPDLSVVFGWALAGAAAYFAYGLVRPSWRNAGGQLAGFLVYDLVLILPFIQHFGSVIPEQRLSLILYTTVVVYSGLLGVYYLVIHRTTRLGA